jgi:chromate transporter
MTDMERKGTFLEVLWAFLKLGVTSFGGPVAHLGFFREEFVAKRQWLKERAYADLVALCQFLPGPASSQVGMGVGFSRAGYPGAIAAWIGFTAPSAVALILFALGIANLDMARHGGWLHGLKVVAVAVVAQAVWGMAKSLCPDKIRASVALAAAMAVLAVPTAWGQVGVIVAGGLFGWQALKSDPNQEAHPLGIPESRTIGGVFLGLFFLLLVLGPVAAAAFDLPWLSIADSFFRSGSLVFGGGHVVLPLIQAEVVPTGWISNDLFMAGYGAAQAVPGPLFTFAAYLGAAMGFGPSGWIGGLVALLGIFLPSFLLVLGALPFWESLRKRHGVQSALMGVNAAVVGLLLAAFYHPVFTSGILSTKDVILGLAAFGLLVLWKAPPWLVVMLGGVGGWLLGG